MFHSTRASSRRLPHVAALLGDVGGPFDVWVLERSATLLANVALSALLAGLVLFRPLALVAHVALTGLLLLHLGDLLRCRLRGGAPKRTSIRRAERCPGNGVARGVKISRDAQRASALSSRSHRGPCGRRQAALLRSRRRVRDR